MSTNQIGPRSLFFVLLFFLRVIQDLFFVFKLGTIIFDVFIQNFLHTLFFVHFRNLYPRSFYFIFGDQLQRAVRDEDHHQDNLDDGSVSIERQQYYIGSACIVCSDEDVLERVGDYHSKGFAESVESHHSRSEFFGCHFFQMYWT